ncbi:MAG: glycosyltransferase family 2 protein [Methylococcaceae bacterium]|nr:MAG: glycosyltransferase family 2 protein [Methylococcaceae bacterium]
MNQTNSQLVEQKYHPLQDVLLPEGKKNVTDLYLRMLTGYTELDEQCLAMEKGAKVSFNTYFNSFYESYWVECTNVRELILQVEYSGSVLVEVFRDTKNHGCHRINWKKLSSGRTKQSLIKISMFGLSGLGEAGRLFLDIIAEKDSKIGRITFLTDQPPTHEPLITLGICTFNREPFLYRNLQEILSYSDVIKSIEKVIVVNQGPDFVDQELTDLIEKSDLIKLIKQRNLGGCGGFTRTMHECLEFHDATHHVLMDDDAFLDARILRNLEYFLGYADKNIVVGGHMLDLLRPWVLYEAGAIVKRNSRIKSMHHNIDLRALGSLLVFNRCHYSDYNAWWFCAIPTEHIEEVQFPAPIFIRGDDMEFGIRLQEKGVKTVALPGIAVWHEPFYIKVGGWQLYYDLRNRLIMASVYPNRFALETPKGVLWMLLRALAINDYLEVNLYCKAIQDYLKGPSLFDTDAEEIHNEVSQLSKAWSPEVLTNAEDLKRPRKIKSMPKSELKRTWLLFRRIFSEMFSVNSGKNKPLLLMDHEVSPANVDANPYVKTNGVGSYYLLYRSDRKKHVDLLIMCSKTFYAYLKNRSNAATAWAENIERLRSGEHWSSVFIDDK